MYNLNVNVNANPTITGALGASAGIGGSSGGLLSVAVATAGEVTPRTPEIVNSLIAMTNPFDGYAGGSIANSCGGRSRDRTDSTSSGEPSPPSIQHTCSQLIKEGLKLTLQTKRKANGVVDENKKRAKREDGSADDEEENESSNSKSNAGLTPEDEERRRRRRERNKIAATKCRLKKREKTVILVQESETLETQNHELKSQIQELETERRRLVDMLNLHGPTCLKQPAHTDSYQQYTDSGAPLPSYRENFVPALSQTSSQSDCAIVSDFGSVKVEDFEPPNFFRQTTPSTTTLYGSTTTMASSANTTDVTG
ncbi:activating transcription factor 3 [Copidosoma floridanum]|uniref:activating transcription factor 3 n=1 Tax=Copidosoma floridanum TaxID=29053 RepID=UPI0006C9872D|nr:activating transcription factor 3 [Copidosoma floridanum]XP_014216622.1 activating transcription factor 3 [Copidosoma floridanum]